MKCPNCGKPTQWDDSPYRPFCSERCKLVDLSRWVNEEYRVPGTPDPEETNQIEEGEAEEELD